MEERRGREGGDKRRRREVEAYLSVGLITQMYLDDVLCTVNLKFDYVTLSS